MWITGRGQVTIPQNVRERLGLLPHTEVEFELAADHVRIRKVKPTSFGERSKRMLKVLRGTADTGMSTDEIMALTRDAKQS